MNKCYFRFCTGTIFVLKDKNRKIRYLYKQVGQVNQPSSGTIYTPHTIGNNFVLRLRCDHGNEKKIYSNSVLLSTFAIPIFYTNRIYAFFRYSLPHVNICKVLIVEIRKYSNLNSSLNLSVTDSFFHYAIFVQCSLLADTECLVCYRYFIKRIKIYTNSKVHSF